MQSFSYFLGGVYADAVCKWHILGDQGVFRHQSEARTAATVWNWSGKTLSPGALLAVLYFSFVPYVSPV